MSITQESAEALRDAFMERPVIVYLKDMQIIMPGPENDLAVSAMSEGFVVDIDEDFVYLGLEDGTVTRALSHAAIGIMELQSAAIDAFGVINEQGDTH